MIHPHYVELNLKTISSLLQHLTVSEKTFVELYRESVTNRNPYYIYHHRLNKNGLASWETLTEKELREHYLDGREIDPKSKTHFIKI